jgi:hypothetical protein
MSKNYGHRDPHPHIAGSSDQIWHTSQGRFSGIAALQPSSHKNKFQKCQKCQKSIITASTTQLFYPPGVKKQAQQQEKSMKTNMIEAMHFCCCFKGKFGSVPAQKFMFGQAWRMANTKAQ